MKAAANLFTLSQVIQPDRALARLDAKAGVPAYVYYFSHVPEGLRGQVPGAGHGAEIAYVFDRLPKTAFDRPASDHRPGPTHFPAATPTDEKISRAMHAYWVAFAKTGAPGAAGGPDWRPAHGRRRRTDRVRRRRRHRAPGFRGGQARPPGRPGGNTDPRRRRPVTGAGGIERLHKCDKVSADHWRERVWPKSSG